MVATTMYGTDRQLERGLKARRAQQAYGPSGGEWREEGNATLLQQISNTRENVLDAERLSRRRREVELKLLADEQKVRLLKESLQTGLNRSQAMAEIFSSFDSRLQRLEAEIRPIHKSTTHLNMMKENIDSAHEVFEEITAMLNVYDNIKDFVLDFKNTKDAEEYISRVSEAESARVALEEAKLTCGQQAVDNLRTLVSKGTTALEAEFKSVLQQHSFTGDFTAMLTSPDTAQQVLEQQLQNLYFPTEVADKLHAMAVFLTETVQTSRYAKHYILYRSDVLWRSLKSLATDSLETGGSLSMAKSPGRHWALNDMSSFSSFETDSGGIAQALYLGPLNTRPYEKGTHPYLTVIEVFTMLLVGERQRARKILPLKVWQETFEEVATKSVDTFIKTGDSIVKGTLKAAERRQFQNTLDVFDILEHFNGRKFDQALECAGKAHAQKLLDLNTNVMLACSQMLQDIETDIKKNTSKGAPDGTVHELTIKTLSICNKLYSYIETVEQVLKATESKAENDGLPKFGDYVARIIMTLHTTLQGKSQGYTDKVLQTVFMLNNDHHILKTVRAAEYFPLMGNAFERTFNGIMQAQAEVYKLTWTKALNYLQEKPSDPSMRFSRNQRDELKERFRGFNSEFEDMVARQARCTVPEEELRAQLRTLSIDLLLPAYKDFRNRVDDIFFSNNPQKYVKYSVQSLKIHLQKFFDPKQTIQIAN